MKITGHSSFNFRNIKQAHIEPDPEMNIIFGKNGQGKTNLIESIWMMTGFYSFRARKNIQLIMQDEEQAVIRTGFYSFGRQQNAELTIGEKKSLILNGVKEDSPRAIMGSFSAVVFSPSTLGIVQNGPSERRRIMDVALSQMKPNYALAMSRYLRAIEQRNALLKKYGEKCETMADFFAPWEEEIINIGAKIVRYRLDYVEKLAERAAKENISDEEIKEKLRSDLEKGRAGDIKRAYTSSGPHAHDLMLTLDGREARVYGSQGQQRSCALAMKLSEADIIEKVTGESPAVLLDDVMSELDEGRQSFILNYLDGRQVFITCCDPANLMRSEKGKVFEVSKGEIREM